MGEVRDAGRGPGIVRQTQSREALLCEEETPGLEIVHTASVVLESCREEGGEVEVRSSLYVRPQPGRHLGQAEREKEGPALVILPTESGHVPPELSAVDEICAGDDRSGLLSHGEVVVSHGGEDDELVEADLNIDTVGPRDPG